MKINRILRYICISGLFIIPLIAVIVSNSMFFPYITGKNFAFRIIVEIISAAWLILAVTDVAYRPRKSWLAWGVAIFVGVMLIADIFSMNPYKSFWSNYERMEGWVTLIHLLAYFFVAGSMLTQKLWDRFWQTWLGVSLVTVIYSIFQFTKIVKGSQRVDATFGNPTYLAIFVIFCAFICLLFIVRKSNQVNSGKHRFVLYGFNGGILAYIFFSLGGLQSLLINAGDSSKVIAWTLLSILLTNIIIIVSSLYEDGRLLYGLIFLAEFFVLYNTQTRGSIIGFIAGLGLVAVLVAIFEKQNKLLRKGALYTLGAIIVVIVAFLVVRNTNFVKNNPTLNRFATISASDGTTESRFLLWGMAWKGFHESPKTVLIGWGQESFNYIFNKYYDPRMYGQEQWFDRAHNVFFDWLTQGGFLGLASYLFVFGAVIWYIWKRDNGLSVIERSLLTGVLAAYFINNVFVFDNVVSYIMYFSVAAYVYGRTSQWAVQSEHSYTENRLVLPLTAVVMLCVLYIVNVPAIHANYSLIEAITPQKSAADTLNSFKKTLAYNSFGSSETREQLYSVTDQIISIISQQQTKTQAMNDIQNNFLNLVDSETKRQLARTPNDARYYVIPGSVFAHAGKFDKALPLLKKAAELSPKKQTILFELASAELSSGDVKDATAVLKQAYELDKNFETARIYYAVASIYNRDSTTANMLLNDLPLTTVANNDQIMQALYAAGQYKQVVELWKVRVNEDPNNAQNHASLGAAYLLLKDKKDAIAEFQTAIKLDPNFKTQGEQYIKAIQSGLM